MLSNHSVSRKRSATKVSTLLRCSSISIDRIEVFHFPHPPTPDSCYIRGPTATHIATSQYHNTIQYSRRYGHYGSIYQLFFNRRKLLTFFGDPRLYQHTYTIHIYYAPRCIQRLLLFNSNLNRFFDQWYHRIASLSGRMLYYAAISNTNPASGIRIIIFYSTISFFFFFLLLSRYCSKFLDVVVSIHIIFCNCFVLTPSSDPTGTHGDWSSSDASVRQNGHPNI